MNLRQALYDTIHATKLGREVLLKYFGKLAQVEEKYLAGLVSEADKESEYVIKNFLLNKYPNTEFLGEESSFAGDEVSEGRGGHLGRWICDPLDGTTNYIHQFPVFCISIGYEQNGELLLGVIDVPMLGETYTAIKGHGAFVNGNKLKINPNKDLKKALLATGFFPDDKVALQEQIQLFSSIVGDCRGIRRAGAAAYDLCQVARGVFDGFWEKNLSPWDVAAGQLLVEEAGGVLKDYNNQPHTPYSRSVIAGNPLIVEQIYNKFIPMLSKK
ncbi:MAG: inositol monophosphatase [Bdellovibrionaceae bacterium]|nr:inositol monophosphatase [Pseudobdellovibrionaceae bacterium]NUM57154.1 inositol monophosphatase [Pseudobdellovibrionaceae bacterium]